MNTNHFILEKHEHTIIIRHDKTRTVSYIVGKHTSVYLRKGLQGMRVTPPSSGTQYAKGRYAVRKNPVISYADIIFYF